MDTPKIPLLLATQNAHKKEELQAILQNWQIHRGIELPLEIQNAPADVDVEENGMTFVENARTKAQGYAAILKPASGYVLAEDSGVSVAALEGFQGLHPFPGVRSKRWLTDALKAEIWGGDVLSHNTAEQDLINQAILKLTPQDNRKAAYHCAMALLSAGGEICCEIERTIPMLVALEPKGYGGFGYDPIFKLDSAQFQVDNPEIDMAPYRDKTLAELPAAGKNTISHRAKAFEAVLDAFVEILLARSAK